MLGMLMFVGELFLHFPEARCAPLSTATSPIPSLTQAKPNIIFQGDTAGTRNAFGQREKSDIIISCLATIFTCTWTAMHPNFPRPLIWRGVYLAERLAGTVQALLLPEITIFMALLDFTAAKRSQKLYNMNVANVPVQAETRYPHQVILRISKAIVHLVPLRKTVEWLCQSPLPPPIEEGEVRPWSFTHGFFLHMGGFVLHDENQRLCRIENIHQLQELIKQGTIDPPTITEEEIKDRSKGDSISKAIVLLQTTWFAVQCVARWVERLPVTNLEVITLGYAMLNVVMYFLWWSKPQSAAVPVYLKAKNPRSIPVARVLPTGQTAETAESEILIIPESEDTRPRITAPGDAIMMEPNDIVADISGDSDSDTAAAVLNITPAPNNFDDQGSNVEHIPDFDTCSESPLITSFADEDAVQISSTESRRQLLGVQSQISRGSVLSNTTKLLQRAITTFTWQYGVHCLSENPCIYCATAAISILFGLIHLIPLWTSLGFPSLNAEQKHACKNFSIVLCVLPAVLLAFLILASIRALLRLMRKASMLVVIRVIFNLGCVLALGYIYVRIRLTILAVRSLQALTPDTLLTVKWTSFIPHL